MSVHHLSAWRLWSLKCVLLLGVGVTVFKTEVNQGLETFCSWWIGLVVLLEVLHSEYSGMSHQERNINFYCALPIISGMSYSLSCLELYVKWKHLANVAESTCFLFFIKSMSSIV